MDETYETDDTDSENTDNELTLFENPNEPYVLRKRVIGVRDNYILRKDVLTCFVTQEGEPCDMGAEILQAHDKLPDMANGTIGRAQITTNQKPLLILLTIKDARQTRTNTETMEEALRSLLDVCGELNLESVSICKGDVDDIQWETIERLLNNLFYNSQTKIMACTNEVICPPANERQRIIKEQHASSIGGHKGVTKTYLRIKQKFYWNRMKTDVQTYIQNCRNCQLRKLVRFKTRQPMILTDTPGKAFEKISMDIMGPLPVTREYLYLDHPRPSDEIFPCYPVEAEHGH